MSQPPDNAGITLSSLLPKLNREDLLALITDLVKREPDLQPWIQSWAETRQGASGGGASLPARVTVNPAEIRRQVAAAFPGESRSRARKPREIAHDLRQILELGDRYAQAAQWANAGVVYSLVATETIAHYWEIDDYNFEIDVLIAGCAGPIEHCLVAQAAAPPSDRMTPELRLTLLRAMYRIWDHLKDRGDLADELTAVIAELATPDEMAQLEAANSA